MYNMDPPNSTTLFFLTFRNENEEHGGGFVPVVAGEFHWPKSEKINYDHITRK